MQTFNNSPTKRPFFVPEGGSQVTGSSQHLLGNATRTYGNQGHLYGVASPPTQHPCVFTQANNVEKTIPRDAPQLIEILEEGRKSVGQKTKLSGYSKKKSNEDENDPLYLPFSIEHLQSSSEESSQHYSDELIPVPRKCKCKEEAEGKRNMKGTTEAQSHNKSAEGWQRKAVFNFAKKH